MAQTPEGRSRRVGRLKLNEAQGLRQKILDAALRLFRRHGYNGTSVEAIASAAGISKRSVYSRFANKTVLFTMVIEAVVQQIIVPPIATGGERGGEPGGEATLVPALAEAAGRLVRPQAHPIVLEILQIVMLDVEAQQDLAAAARASGLAPIVAWLGGLLRAQGVAGMDDARRRFLAESLFGLLVMAPRLGLPRPGRSDPALLAQTQAEMIQLFVAGCLAPGPDGLQAATDNASGESEAAVKAPPDR